MLIKKLNGFFHKHSRILFGAFTVLIIVAFTDFLTPGNISGCDAAANTQVGTAFGKKVTADDLQKTYRDLSIYALVLYGGEMNFEAQRIFYQYCQIKRAEQLGVVVSDAEIAEKIKASPVFNGKFTMAAYDKFLKDRNLNAAEVNEAIRRNMKVEKMLQTMMDSVVVSDTEAKAMFMSMDQQRKMAVCSFKYDSFKVDEPKDKELEAMFNKNPERYMTSGSLKTVSAVVPLAKFMKAAEAKVTPEAIAKIRKDERIAPEYNDELLKLGLIQRFAFAEAQKEANALLKEFNSKHNAADPADKQIAAFRAWAADKSLEIVEDDSAFNEYNQVLQRMPLDGSRLLRGIQSLPNGVAIVMLESRVEPQKQTFAQAKSLVAVEYKVAAQKEKAKQAAEAAIKEINALKGEARLKAFKALKGEHSDDNFPLMPFAAAYKYYEEQLGSGMQVMQMCADILKMEVYDISPAAETPAGVEIRMIVSKTPADEKAFEASKADYIYIVKNMKVAAVLQAFSEDMQRQCQFTMSNEKTGDKAAEKAK